MEKVMFKYLTNGSMFEYETLWNEPHIAMKLPVANINGSVVNAYDTVTNAYFYINIFNKVLLSDLYAYIPYDARHAAINYNGEDKDVHII